MPIVCFLTVYICVVLTDNDPWLKYCCSAPANPQLLFVVGNAWISSPLPRVSVSKCVCVHAYVCVCPYVHVRLPLHLAIAFGGF